MFDFSFDDLKASVFVESRDAAMAYQHGAAEITPGNNTISSNKAIELIRKLDRLQRSVPKCQQKRWRSLRNQFVFAFGPEMEVRIK
ncbi:TPA: hypothetical protein ACK1B7_004394 [Serratia marcescens]|uniref:hypothetical protein n=1 Tax=Serratia marcescens TaxID=615 RepID=UPI00235FEA81|nr:hypothetical protein [Serratia marcescens]